MIDDRSPTEEVLVRLLSSLLFSFPFCYHFWLPQTCIMGNETEHHQNVSKGQHQPGNHNRYFQKPNNIINNQEKFDPAKHGPRAWETPVAIVVLVLTMVSINSLKVIDLSFAKSKSISTLSIRRNEERTTEINIHFVFSLWIIKHLVGM